MSEVWEDLGSHQKIEEADRKRIAAKRYEHEVKELSEARKMKNLEVIEKLKEIADVFEVSEAVVKVKIKHRVFEFYPSSDCWYSQAKNQYGIGTEKLAELIRRKLGNATEVNGE